MLPTSSDGCLRLAIAPGRRWGIALVAATVALGGCANRPSPTRDAVVDYHEAADRYLNACLNLSQDCNDSTAVRVKALFDLAWKAARYERGTRVYLAQHDRIRAEMLCGLHDERGCPAEDFDATASMAQLERLDRREYR